MDRDLGERLDWDSRFFGFPVGRLSCVRLTSTEATAATMWAVDAGLRCLYFLCDATDTGSATAAENVGFRLTDVRLTLNWFGTGPPAMGPNIRPAESSDAEVLAPIARTAHTDSRFFADPHFTRVQCEDLYESWLRRSIGGWADRVFVAEVQGRAVGYITCHGGLGRAGNIGLFGVGDGYQGRGLGGQLIAAAIGWLIAAGSDPITVVTQGRNVRAQRAYQRSGFLSNKVEFWFHAWFEPSHPKVHNP